MLQMNIRATSEAITRFAVYLFAPLRIYTIVHYGLACFASIRVTAGSTLTRTRCFFSFFWTFQEYLWFYFSGHFLDFTRNISELFSKVTDKFLKKLLGNIPVLKFPGTFLEFLTMFVIIRSFKSLCIFYNFAMKFACISEIRIDNISELRKCTPKFLFSIYFKTACSTN